MRRSAAALVVVAAVLVGWRWHADRHGARPTELHRQAVQAVDLNRATRSELLQVPGIGPSLADRIVAHRDAHGRFSRVEDLDRVPGFGAVTVERVRPWVTVLAVAAEPSVTEPDRLSRKPPTRHVTLKPTVTLVNVNTATPDELNALPGIGPVLARRMIDERARRPFASVEDLGRVSGIGPKRREALRGLVTFD